MTGPGSNWGLEEWLTGPGDEPNESFKWGWNRERGAAVWPVGGPGDGLPSHREQLQVASGRGPATSLGDVVGVASRYASRMHDELGKRQVVEVTAFYGHEAPTEVVDWFRRAFPEALIRSSGP